MKKLLVRASIAVVVLAALAGAGIFAFIKMNSPAAEERLAYNREELVAEIDKQLAGLDLDSIRAKAHFIENKTVAEIKHNIAAGELTYEQLVGYYLLRIKEIDQSELGNNAVSEINPEAIAEARALDAAARRQGPEVLSQMYGVPVLLKENINTSNMPTSAGAHALKDFTPAQDAPFVRTLRNNGALILGKTNLSEMSHFMSLRNPSGYSAKNGQTHNPFGPLNISPLGSSSGSAVAMATGLAAVSFGTETTGSIVAPASINSVVGFKPTRGSIDASGVIPISSTLDTVGPITTTVEDAALAHDAATQNALNPNFDAGAMKGKRIGVIPGNSVFTQDLQKQLQAMGAEAVEINPDTGGLDNLFILNTDFEKDLNAYFAEFNAPISSLAELIEYNKKDPQIRARYGQNLLEGALNFADRDEAKVAQMVADAQSILTTTMRDYRLDAIVFQDNTGALLSAIAGAPEVSVPFGKYDGKPAGATFSAQPGDDKALLEIAYSFEQNTRARQLP